MARPSTRCARSVRSTMSARDRGHSRGPAGKKGRLRNKQTPKDTIAIIDHLLEQPCAHGLDGERVCLPTLEVIVLQLLQQEMKGSSRARQILLQYQQFGVQHPRGSRSFTSRKTTIRAVAQGEAHQWLTIAGFKRPPKGRRWKPGCSPAIPGVGQERRPCPWRSASGRSRRAHEVSGRTGRPKSRPGEAGFSLRMLVTAQRRATSPRLQTS